MAEYDNNMRGALWKNTKRETEKHPNLTGQAEIDGTEYWINAWTSKGEGNKPMVTLSFKRKESRPKDEWQNVPADDDIPW